MKLFTAGETNWRYIFIVAVLAILAGGILAWQYWPALKVPEANVPAGAEENETAKRECAKEGEARGDIMGGRDCCSGLVQRDITYPMRNKANEVVCVEEMTRAICVKSGDGVCGKGEDWCISPEDCPKPDPVNLELYPL